MDTDQISVGQHTVKVVATDGVGLSEPKSIAVETHGDRKSPAIALSGSMTEQATLGTTRPAYVIKAIATDPGEAAERQSGVASMSIKVDGNVVDSTSPGCPSGGCSLTREWSLTSSSYAVGAHSVEVAATDAAGRFTTKSFNINIARDTIAPTLVAGSEFFTAPEGWVEQKSYSYVATAKDPGGYGITSLVLTIDGKNVSSASQACPNGGCEKTLSATIDMSNYKGGAHPAELIATDGAGLVTKKTWTVNVAPNGSIGAAEAEDTIEAVEETSGDAVIVPGSETENPFEEEEPPILIQDGEDINSDGSPVEATMTTDPSDGFQLSTSEGLVSIVPIDTEGTPMEPTSGAEAGISGNTGPAVDTVIRPIYDGSLQFQQIRATAAPEQYTWKVICTKTKSLNRSIPEPLKSMKKTPRKYFIRHSASGPNTPTMLLAPKSRLRSPSAMATA